MEEQARKVCFVYRSQFTSHAAEQLALELVELAPAGIDYAFFVSGGSEATELTMRSALQYWRELGQPGKTRILGRRISYHGMTMGSLSMSGHETRRADYSNLLHDLALAPPPYEYRFPAYREDAEEHGAAAWDRILQQQNPDTIAAVIVEPIVGAAGGALTPPVGYLRALRRICDRHNVLLIADEVITGLGRTGTWFACQQDDIAPDLIAVGKGLSSGYSPIGGVLFRNQIVEAFRKGSKSIPYGHTFSNNPLSAATCLAVLRYMKRMRVLENVSERGLQLYRGLCELSSRFPCMADIRGRGLLWGFEFVADRETRKPPPAGLQANIRFAARCFDAGLIVYPAGFAPYNNATLISPPLTISEAEVDELLHRLGEGLASFSRDLAG